MIRKNGHISNFFIKNCFILEKQVRMVSLPRFELHPLYFREFFKLILLKHVHKKVISSDFFFLLYTSKTELLLF